MLLLCYSHEAACHQGAVNWTPFPWEKTIVFSNPHNHFLLINTTVKLAIDTYWKSGWRAAVQRENYFICSQRGHSQVGNDNSSVQKDKQVCVLRKKYQMTNCTLRHSSNVLSRMVSMFPFPHQNTWRCSRALGGDWETCLLLLPGCCLKQQTWHNVDPKMTY